MPPFTPSNGLINDGVALGFTSPLIETIAQSRSKVQNWVDREKAKMDSAAESYRKSLIEQERIINSQIEDLMVVQREIGMEDAGTSSEDNLDQPENIAEQKKSLEEQVSKVQIDVMKLTTERENRERRVKGKHCFDRSNLTCKYAQHVS